MGRPVAIEAPGLTTVRAATQRAQSRSMTRAAGILVGQWLDAALVTHARDVGMAFGAARIRVHRLTDSNIVVATDTVEVFGTRRRDCEDQDRRNQESGESCGISHFRDS